jgi:branched-chain amino acid transport system permease protein
MTGYAGALRFTRWVALPLLPLAAVAWAPDEARAFLLGIGSGCLVSAIALGVVLTYRGSGVVNFATGAMAAFSAYVYDTLRRDGSIVLPPLPNPLSLFEGVAHLAGADRVRLPDLPTSISFGGPLDFAPAVGVTLLAAAAVGLLCHALVFRPLRGAPPLAKLVASVGVLILLQAMMVLRFTSTPRPVRPILAKTGVHLPGDIVMPRDQLVLGAAVVAGATLLWALFRFTRFGLASRAAAENEKAAAILGFSPDVLAGVNWVLSTVLVALFGVLVATVNGAVDPITIPLLIVPALGAALLGGFTSFAMTTAAGFGIAMSQNLVQYVGTQSWFPHAGGAPLAGLKESLPFVVIAVALFVRGRSLPTRETITGGRLPRVPPSGRAARRAVPAVLVAGSGLFLLGPEWRLAITNTLVGTLVCLSLVVLTGFVGQISLAQMTLAGIAGFALSKLATTYGVPFPLGPLLGGILASAVGLLAAIPALRIRGVNLAVLTLAAAVAIESAIFRSRTWSGSAEGASVPPPRLFGLRFGPNDPGSLDGKIPNPWFGVFCLLVVVMLAVAVVHLRSSATGLRMLAVRSNERAAAAIGVNVAGTKLLAFGFSAFIAGIAGSLSGYRFGSVSPAVFGSSASLLFLAFAYLGGITSVTGAVIGGSLVAGGISFTVLHEWLAVPEEYTLLLGGLGLVVTAVLNPEGISGAVRHAAQRAHAVVSSRQVEVRGRTEPRSGATMTGGATD